MLTRRSFIGSVLAAVGLARLVPKVGPKVTSAIKYIYRKGNISITSSGDPLPRLSYTGINEKGMWKSYTVEFPVNRALAEKIQLANDNR